jgi:histidinol phosphatase-like PHP family hydrolase
MNFSQKTSFGSKLMKMPWSAQVANGVKLVINSDAHRLSQMDQLDYGVAIARRDWVGKQDIINSQPLKKLKSYLNL